MFTWTDGELLDTINQDSSGLDYQEAWGYCGLENGQTHAIVLHQSDGALMDVDALIAENNPVADDDDSLINYDLGWLTYSGTGPLGGSIHYSETVGSQAKLTFSGTSPE